LPGLKTEWKNLLNKLSKGLSISNKIWALICFGQRFQK
jgi:hypothetical protein